MARIEWVKHRLDNWALWKVREQSGGMGFAPRSVLLSDAVDCSREIRLPVDEIDAEKTNQAVESLRASKEHLYITLQLIYIEGLGIKFAAGRMGKAESTIKANLDQADHLLSAWFSASAKKDCVRFRASGGLST